MSVQQGILQLLWTAAPAGAGFPPLRPASPSPFPSHVSGHTIFSSLFSLSPLYLVLVVRVFELLIA